MALCLACAGLAGSCGDRFLAADTTTLRQLAEEHADSMGMILRSLRFREATTIMPANREEWIGRLSEDLHVSYAPLGESPGFLPLALVSDFLSIEMAGGRTPEDVVSDVARPGHLVLAVEWRFSGGRTVRSHAVFGIDEALLFDTILAFPLMRVPFMSAAHF